MLYLAPIDEARMLGNFIHAKLAKLETLLATAPLCSAGMSSSYTSSTALSSTAPTSLALSSGVSSGTSRMARSSET
jgi:hypothetical protein